MNYATRLLVSGDLVANSQSTQNSAFAHFRFVILMIALSWILCLKVGSQSKEQIPIPEYYGTYAVINGQLIKLDSSESRLPKTTNVRLGQRNAVGDVLRGGSVAGSHNIEIAEFPPDLKIIVYAQSSGMISPAALAQSFHLESLVFVRNVNVDTGWPNGVRRNGPENGWESGDAPELGGMSSGGQAKSLEFLVKPISGQKDMVIATPEQKLKPGVYRLMKGPRDPLMGPRGLLFAVQPIAEAEVASCVDASIVYAMMTSNVKYRPCAVKAVSTVSENSQSPGGAQRVASEPLTSRPASSESASPPTQPSTMPPNGVPGCGEYEACLQAGIRAFNTADWGSAGGDLQSAIAQRPTVGDPWVWLGKVYLGAGNGALGPAWDKAINLGSSIEIEVCHERAFRPCESGTMGITPKTISFRTASQTLFEATPSEVQPKRIYKSPISPRIVFTLHVGSKNYDFDFVPLGKSSSGTCLPFSNVACPPDALAQQQAVANYVASSIPKLADGSLGKPSLPPDKLPQVPQLAGFAAPAGTLGDIGLGWLGLNPDFQKNPIHLGVDFVRKHGTPVYSIADGEIVLVDSNLGSYGGAPTQTGQAGKPGGAMIVKHKTDSGQIFYALYGHLENMKPVGPIKRGEQLATVGHYYEPSGRDGSHLHFAVFFGDSLPSGNGWPWRQYIAQLSDNPGWKDPLFVLQYMKPAP